MKSSNCKAGWEGGGVTKGEKWRGGERGVCLAAQKRWKRCKLQASVCYGNIFYEYFTENYFIGFSMSHLGIDMPCSVMSDATLLSW